MNSSQLEYFLSLCDSLNYSESARRLYVSQPTISKQIALLEDELNTKLFERNKSAIVLTPKGLIVQEAFKKISSTFFDMVETLESSNESDVAHIRFAILEGTDIASTIVNSLTKLKEAVGEKIELSFDFMEHPELNSSLDDNLIDIGITLREEVENLNNIDSIYLRHLSHGIVAHKSLNIMSSRKLNYERLRKQKFYVTEYGSRGYKGYISHLIDTLELDKSMICITPNIETQILNVEAGMGISALSMTPRIQNNPSLEFFPIDNLQINVVAAWNKSNSNKAVRHTINHIRRIIDQRGYF